MGGSGDAVVPRAGGLCRATGAPEVEDRGVWAQPQAEVCLLCALNENTDLIILFPIRFYHLC